MWQLGGDDLKTRFEAALSEAKREAARATLDGYPRHLAASFAFLHLAKRFAEACGAEGTWLAAIHAAITVAERERG
ncbi:MAG TPA: hypothetical protein VIL95_05940 [Bacillota bacterium]